MRSPFGVWEVLVNNITEIVRNDMASTISKGSKISIAAACFSMYAYKELKKQLESVEECRFIFTYKDNYVNNPIAADRLNYDVLFHTDLSRSHGFSNGLDLDRLNWGNYDLVVIDESHNFRNGAGTHVNTHENRYVKLMDKIIRAGVKTKVLMLSATPVNNGFTDLKNQLAMILSIQTLLL